MKSKNIFKILTVIISSLIILACLAACDKNPKVPDETTTDILETTEIEMPDETTTQEEETTIQEEEIIEEKTTEEEETSEDVTTTEKEEEKTTEEVTSKPVTTTKKQETTTKKETTTQKETTTKKQDTAKYTSRNETVYATENVNIRKEASTSSAKIGGLKKGQSIKRIAIGDNGWSKVDLNGTTAYVASSYLTTTKPTTTTTKKQETTTKKPAETTTQKPVTTTRPSGSATQTSGGIALKPITSSTAKTIANSSALFMKYESYEGKSADGKKIVVYAKTLDGWTGRDIEGTLYDANGKIRICNSCGNPKGQKEGMCDGFCSIVLH